MYLDVGRRPPFDPYLLMLSTWEHTQSVDIQNEIRKWYKPLSECPFYSAHKQSFQSDVSELCKSVMTQCRNKARLRRMIQCLLHLLRMSKTLIMTVTKSL